MIPRDFQLDPVRDLPVHVDFMRLAEGATIRVSIPIHVINTDQSPGIKRGGAVNIVTHTLDVRCPADAIPEAFDVDVSGLEINYSQAPERPHAAAQCAPGGPGATPPL